MVKLRLLLIIIMMILSVVVDSVYYLVSALTDFMFMGAVVVLAWPLVKTVLAKPEE